MFEMMKDKNKVIVDRLDAVLDKYGKVEAELRERMREMMDVRQAIEIIGQRQENLEVVQKNLGKLQTGNILVKKRTEEKSKQGIDKLARTLRIRSSKR